MLTSNALQLFQRPEPRLGEVFTLRCLLHHERIIDKHHLSIARMPQELVREVKSNLLTSLWYQLYGDVIKALPQLHHECLIGTDRTLMRGSESPIEKGFGEIMTMLKPPIHWLDGMEPKVLPERSTEGGKR